jgi:predicted MFS family arabinose efflux permease
MTAARSRYGTGLTSTLAGAWPAVIVATLGCLTAIVSPVLVGALVATGRPASVAGAYLFTELWGCFAGALCAIPLSMRWSWRRIAAVGFAGLVVANGSAVLFIHSPALAAIRGLAGIAAGLAYGAGYACAGASAEPVREFARIVFLQLAITVASAYTIPAVNTPSGASLLFAVMAALGLVGIAVAQWLPSSAPTAVRQARRPRGQGWWLSVSAVFCNFCGYGAVWAYAEAFGLQARVSSAFLATSLAVAAACGGIGALVAERVSAKVRPGVPLLLSLGLGVAALAGLSFTTHAWIFAIAIGAVQLSWASGVPFIFGLIATRSTESAVVASSALEIAGVAVGPGAAALVVDRYGVSAVVAVGAVFLLGYALAIKRLAGSPRHSPAAAGEIERN